MMVDYALSQTHYNNNMQSFQRNKDQNISLKFNRLCNDILSLINCPHHQWKVNLNSDAVFHNTSCTCGTHLSLGDSILRSVLLIYPGSSRHAPWIDTSLTNSPLTHLLHIICTQQLINIACPIADRLLNISVSNNSSKSAVHRCSCGSYLDLMPYVYEQFITIITWDKMSSMYLYKPPLYNAYNLLIASAPAKQLQ